MRLLWPPDSHNLQLWIRAGPAQRDEHREGMEVIRYYTMRGGHTSFEAADYILCLNSPSTPV